MQLQAAHEVVALAGFHIKRQEFEPEYDNEAEMIVADMEFNDDDTEVTMRSTGNVEKTFNKPVFGHEPGMYMIHVCTCELHL